MRKRWTQHEGEKEREKSNRERVNEEEKKRDAIKKICVHIVPSIYCIVW